MLGRTWDAWLLLELASLHPQLQVEEELVDSPEELLLLQVRLQGCGWLQAAAAAAGCCWSSFAPLATTTVVSSCWKDLQQEEKSEGNTKGEWCKAWVLGGRGVWASKRGVCWKK